MLLLLLLLVVTQVTSSSGGLPAAAAAHCVLAPWQPWRRLVLPLVVVAAAMWSLPPRSSCQHWWQRLPVQPPRQWQQHSPG
jgi:hypothetical protein